MFDNNENEYVIEGESTLANKIRRQKELVIDDREEMFPSRSTASPTIGFEVVYGGWVNSEGGLESPRVVIFSDRKSFEEANPNWDARNRQEFPFTILGDIYLYDRPLGGYEIYP